MWETKIIWQYTLSNPPHFFRVSKNYTTVPIQQFLNVQFADDGEKAEIRQSMDLLESHTCVTFHPAGPAQRDKILIKDGDGLVKLSDLKSLWTFGT